MATSPLVQHLLVFGLWFYIAAQPASEAPKVKVEMLRHINTNRAKKNMEDWYSHIPLKYLPQ
ncbi:MAG TPA: hypothetical protein V6D20_02080 [Candidatus Obscuribacterales bacterium]